MSAIDVQTADLWVNIATRRWGKYLTEVEWDALRFALDQFPQPGEALEVGAEAGRWTQRLISRGWKMTCTDICADKVQLCQQNNPAAECHLVSGEDTRLPVDSDSQDLVFAIEVPISSDPWFVQECQRVLRPGGYFVSTLLNRSSWRGVVDRFKSEEQFYSASYRTFRRSLQHHDFAILRTEGFAWLPLPRFSDSPLARHARPLETFTGLRKLSSFSPWVTVVARIAS